MKYVCLVIIIIFLYVIFPVNILNHVFYPRDLKESLYEERECLTAPVYDYFRVEAWIEQNIKYVSDDDYDHWQSPLETLIKRTGDCEDKAILFMYLVSIKYPEWNKDGKFILIQFDHADQYHMIVAWDKDVYGLYNRDDFMPLLTYGKIYVNFRIKFDIITDFLRR